MSLTKFIVTIWIASGIIPTRLAQTFNSGCTYHSPYLIKNKDMRIISIIILFALMASSCLKKKNEEPSANNPLSPTNSGEIITTIKIYIKDSVSGNYIIGSPFTFKDADGDGGNIGTYLPNSSDS